MVGTALVETVQVKKGEYKAILAIAGAGFIGNTVGMFIARNKKYKQVALLKSTYTPPMVLFIEGVPTPSFRIYVDDAGGLFFVITESLIPSEGSYEISATIMKWLKDKGVKEIYTIDGLPFASTGEIKVLGYSNKFDLTKWGIVPLREGAISGLNACVLEECLEKGIPFTAFFIPTNILTTVDYGGSAQAVEVLNKIFKLGVDPSPLKKSDEAIRKAMEKKPSGFGRVFR